MNDRRPSPYLYSSYRFRRWNVPKQRYAFIAWRMHNVGKVVPVIRFVLQTICYHRTLPEWIIQKFLNEYPIQPNKQIYALIKMGVGGGGDGRGRGVSESYFLRFENTHGRKQVRDICQRSFHLRLILKTELSNFIVFADFVFLNGLLIPNKEIVSASKFVIWL